MKTINLTKDEFQKLLDLVQERIRSCRRSIKEHQGRDGSDVTIAGKASAALRRWEAIETKLVFGEPPTQTLLAEIERINEFLRGLAMRTNGDQRDTTENASVAP